VIRGQKSDIDYKRLAYLTCRGGWPTALKRNEKVSLEIAKEYVKVLTSSDISEYDGVLRKADLAHTVIRAYSRHVSTINSNKTMFDDIRAFYGDVTDATLYDYLSVYKSLYVIEDIEAWNPNLRSKTSIRTSPKKAFVDPSLGIAALGISPKELALDPETFGLFFENLVNRDLSVYAGKIGGTVRHYRDRMGLECDHVIHFENGKYGLIETKLGSAQTDSGIDKLRDMRDLIRNKNAEANRIIVKEPNFYMVINGGETAVTTDDGIFVVPIGCLKD
jgi:predicted AAA+ superfamily ATPase